METTKQYSALMIWSYGTGDNSVSFDEFQGLNDSAIQHDRGKPLLYRWDDLVLSFSPTVSQLKAHYHGAAELVIAYTGKVYCNLSGGAFVSAASILIPPGVAHKNEYENQLSVTIYVDSDSRCFRHLKELMSAEASVFVALPKEAECQELVRWIYQNQPIPDDCRDRLNSLLTDQHPSSTKLIDPRIQIVLDELRQNPADNRRVGYFAAKVDLSEDRLHHLFTEVVGLPIHRYRIWLRLKHASRLYFAGHGLTYAAHEAGFSDAAHFSRTFKKMYGATPKDTLSSRKTSRYFFA